MTTTTMIIMIITITITMIMMMTINKIHQQRLQFQVPFSVSSNLIMTVYHFFKLMDVR